MWHRILQGRRYRIWALAGLIALGIIGCGGGSDSGGIPAVYTMPDGNALPQTAMLGRYLVTVAANRVPGAPSTTSANYYGNITGPSSVTRQGAYYRFLIQLTDPRQGSRNIYFGPQNRLLQALTFAGVNFPTNVTGIPNGGCGTPIFYTLADSNGNLLQQQAGAYPLSGGQTYAVLTDHAPSSVSAGSLTSSSTTLPLTFSSITPQNGGYAFTVTLPTVTSSTQSSFTIGGDLCYPSTGVSIVVNP